MEILYFIIGLLFVVLFSIVIELFIRCPKIVAGIIAAILLITFGIIFLLDIASTTLIAIAIWIVIYAVAAFITAYLTCRFLRNNDF